MYKNFACFYLFRLLKKAKVGPFLPFPPFFMYSLPVLPTHNLKSSFLPFSVKYFINPSNNYRYVYLIKKDNLKEASKLYASKIDGKYKQSAWVMTVSKKVHENVQLAESIPNQTKSQKKQVVTSNE